MSPTTERIICVGNRWTKLDAAGPRVYDRLVTLEHSPEIEVIDAGLAGIDLLAFMEGATRIVFVDALTEVTGVPGVHRLEAMNVARWSGEAYDHGAGLGYLLRILPDVWEGELPTIELVGIEGPPTRDMVDRAAHLCLRLLSANGGVAEPPRTGASEEDV